LLLDALGRQISCLLMKAARVGNLILAAEQTRQADSLTKSTEPTGLEPTVLRHTDSVALGNPCGKEAFFARGEFPLRPAPDDSDKLDGWTFQLWQMWPPR